MGKVKSILVPDVRMCVFLVFWNIPLLFNIFSKPSVTPIMSSK